MPKGLMSCIGFAMVCATMIATKSTFADGDPIPIGSSTVLTGLYGTAGQQMTLGEQIYFNKINDQGGVLGKKIKLIVYDDGYEPIHTAINMRRLITKDQVLAIIGNVGASTATISVSLANTMSIILYGFYSGAEILRKDPSDKYVYNFRANYAEEAADMIKGLLKAGFKPNDIAFFSKNDASGDFGYSSALKTLRNAGFQVKELPHMRFPRNTLNVEESLSNLLDLKHRPKAIIIFAPYAPVAKFIKLAVKDMPNTIFLVDSSVGSDELSQKLGGVADNRVIVTQVVPDYNSLLPAIKEYREDLKKYAPNERPGFISLEGFLATKLFVLSLEQAAKKQNLTREGIVQALENMKQVDIGIGIPISFDKNHHQALHQIWPTILKNGRFVPFDWRELRLRKDN